ncbi:PREDICTED: cysteine proteinase 15A-like isoform X2 [Amphimedon queenslandica]|uniref:Uncharacterized protein n=1 Tax=Amphimedon queenslandica TaxID=400682 RepID=A0AAN0J4P1_AMPQE|nr:PREDICTED: cysteine proteinase 15A-like isoform X2 [Amphimedon queenslandica]|eukprot:XP_019851717.1 PREDICTED: cysteine proteinase 15A-like isoform X2 [Amphimedon queenslandica]
MAAKIAESISFLFIFLLCFQLAVSSNEPQLSFTDWCKLHSKSYRTITEAKERESVYKSNADLVQQLNNEYRERNVTFSLNHFADLSIEEFKKLVLMSPQKPQPLPKQRYHSFSLPQDPPNTFDWRDKHVVTSVKNQGSAGTCWAFSTVGNVEGQWALGGHNLTSLSTEQLVDCDDTYDHNNLHMDCGVFGGWPYLAYEYIKNEGGIEREEDYPYCSGQGTCFPCVPSGWNKTRCGPPPLYCNDTFSCTHKLDKSKFVQGLSIKSWIAIQKDEVEMQAALIKQGPLSVLINALLLQFYRSGVWDPILKCNPQELDHAVLLVGYGTEKGLLEDKPYWLIKNSWGIKWGMDGYFKMIRGKGKCGVDQQVTSAVLQ